MGITRPRPDGGVMNSDNQESPKLISQLLFFSQLMINLFGFQEAQASQQQWW